MSGLYEIETFGNCLGEAVPDGTRLVVDPTAEIKPLDLVCITLHEDRGPWQRFMKSAWDEAMDTPFANCMSKVFLDRGVRGGHEVILLGQFYPPTIGVIAVDEVKQMHKVVGRAEGSIGACESVREQFELIAWARGEETCKPISRSC